MFTAQILHPHISLSFFFIYFHPSHSRNWSLFAHAARSGPHFACIFIYTNIAYVAVRTFVWLILLSHWAGDFFLSILLFAHFSTEQHQHMIVASGYESHRHRCCWMPITSPTATTTINKCWMRISFEWQTNIDASMFRPFGKIMHHLRPSSNMKTMRKYRSWSKHEDLTLFAQWYIRIE